MNGRMYDPAVGRFLGAEQLGVQEFIELTHYIKDKVTQSIA
jgi:hypothetical protein